MGGRSSLIADDPYASSDIHFSLSALEFIVLEKDVDALTCVLYATCKGY